MPRLRNTNVSKSNKTKLFRIKKKQKKTHTRSRQYPAETMINADNENDIVLLANIAAQAEFVQHRDSI